MLKVGDPAPDFTATAQDGKTVRLQELRGKRVVLFFFPKAFTLGCTIETRQFRDHYSELSELGAEVLGVSVDSSERQCEFASREGVPFPMLGDPSRGIGRSYDVIRPLLNVTRRVTYIIGTDGRVEAIFHHEIRVGKHLDDVRSYLQKHKA
jgi:peroxiredoxin Q/BCP